MLGALLNAPGLHKTAFNQEDGVRRDVALALTGPLADVSHALLLDRPRVLLKESLGRGDDDEIDTAVDVPVAAPKPAPAAGGGTATKPPPRLAFTPERRLRLWVAGDSLAIVPGWSIVRAAGASPVIDPVSGVDGRVATGLERPDVFNWFRHVRKQLAKHRPRAVVLGFGGNDDHGYMTGLPQGVSVDGFGTPSWEREYARRAGGLMDTVTRAGAHLVWIGLPLTRDPEQTRRFDTINAIVQREARRRPGRVSFVDTYTLFADDSGGYAEYLPGVSGRLVRVRGADGVHFEPAGGDIIAREVLKRLNEAYDLTSWRRARS